MLVLAAAGLFLLATHFVSSTPVRPAVVASIGEPAWMALYSLVSLGAFAALILAYRAAPTVWLAAPLPWTRWVPLLVAPIATFLVIAALTTPNPTLALMDGLLEQEDPVKGVLAVTRHPMLWGIGLWSLSHMVANPDVASWLLFGTLAMLSLGGTWALDRKKARDLPETWPAFAAATSNLPFAAVVDGRQTLSFQPRFFAQAVGAGVFTVIFVVIHPFWFGVSALPIP